MLSVSYFHILGCACYILNNKDNLGKFEEKSDKAIFLGYFLSSKAYRTYNLRTQVVEETMHVVFYEYENTLEKRRIVNLEEVKKQKGLASILRNLHLAQKAQRKEKNIFLR